MQHSSTRYVGLDVPNDAMAVASVATAHEAEVIDLGTIGTRQGDIDHSCARFKPKPSPWSSSLKRDPVGPGSLVI